MVDHTWGSEKHKHGMTPVGYGYKSQDAFNYENKYASSEIGEDGISIVEIPRECFKTGLLKQQGV